MPEDLLDPDLLPGAVKAPAAAAEAAPDESAAEPAEEKTAAGKTAAGKAGAGDTAAGKSAATVDDAAARVVRGEPDPLGDTVGKVYIRTDELIIYAADGAARDYGRLRVVLLPGLDRCRELRGNMAPVIGPVAVITDVVCGMRPVGFVSANRREEYESLVERCLVIMAKAMQIAIEGGAERAMQLLEGVRATVEERRDSGNRMRYLLANATALAAIALAWGMIRLAAGAPPGLVSGFFGGSLAFTAAPPLSYLDVLLFGALGAFFSVSIGIDRLKVNHAISAWEMLYTGVVRVMIGVIAAAVVILLIEGGWILGSLDAEYRTWAIYLFGFLAGFSEVLVPNALKQAEGAAPVEGRPARSQPPAG